MLLQDILIRQAKALEFDKINLFIAENPEELKYRKDNCVHFVKQLRENSNYIPELELVAEQGGDLIGHVILSEVQLVANNGNSYKTLFLSPLSLSSGKTNNGVCRALINNSSDIAKSMGFSSIFLFGNPDLFQSLGFQKAKKWNIYHPDFESDLILGKELKSNSLSEISGNLCF